MVKFPKIKVKSVSMKSLLIFSAVLFLIYGLISFNWISMPNIYTIVIGLMGITFLFLEMDLAKVIKGKEKVDVIRALALVIVGLAVIGIILSFFNIENVIISATKGIVGLGLALFSIIEIFR